jgi:hypothetical protein
MIADSDFASQRTFRRRVLVGRALVDLAELAAVMDRRGVDPLDICRELVLASLLWAGLGAPISTRTLLRIIRKLPGLSGWDLDAALKARMVQLLGLPPNLQLETIEPADAEERERRRRAVIFAEWALRHAGLPCVEAAVRAAEDRAAEHLANHARQEVPV